MIELTDPKIQKYLTPYRYEEPVLHGSGILGAFDEKAVDIPCCIQALTAKDISQP